MTRLPRQRRTRSDRSGAQRAPETGAPPADPTRGEDGAPSAGQPEMPSDASVGETLEAVRRLVRSLRLSANRARETAGVSSAELFILRALHDGGPAVSLNALAARTYTDQSSASPIVERLRQRRLIRRQRSTVDARRVTIELTDAGRALLNRAPSPPQAQVITALHRLRPAERAALAHGLSRLVMEMGLAEFQAAMLFEEPPKPRRPRIG
jgi:MarR family transcriptional regulator, organic hydroperoxide resistance regulator